MPHYLITLLGTNTQEASYTLGESEPRSARLAPLALMELLPEDQRPDEVLAFCTKKAREVSLGHLEEGLRRCCPVSPIDIADGIRQEDIYSFLNKLTDALPRDEEIELTVDITHGFRHFSFLTYIGVLYLTALRGIKLRGAYYGLLQREGPSPFLDLKPLLEFPGWVHALRTLEETGSARPLAEMLGRGLENSQTLHRIKKHLSELTQSYLAGLPLEIGKAIAEVENKKTQIEEKLSSDHHLPLADELLDNLMTLLQPLTLEMENLGEGWKGRAELDKQELRRQAGLIDELIERDNYPAAFGLLREWVVSWVIWRKYRAGQWLDKNERSQATRLLGAMSALLKDEELVWHLSDEQRALAVFWNEIGELRNGYAHHGMRSEVQVGGKKIPKTRRRVVTYWQETLSKLPDISLDYGGAAGGDLLVCPLGNASGVLFSALKAVAAETGQFPTTCLVICSKQSQAAIQEAVEAAGYTNQIIPLVMTNPYGGSDEIKPLIEQAREHLFKAERVFVNITGGTTVMGLAAEKLAEEAKGLARPVRRFGLIDRRNKQEQIEDPFQQGETFWLGEDQDNDAKKADTQAVG